MEGKRSVESVYGSGQKKLLRAKLNLTMYQLPAHVKTVLCLKTKQPKNISFCWNIQQVF